MRHKLASVDYAGIILDILEAGKHNARIIGEISSIIEEPYRKFLLQLTQSQGLTCLEFEIMSSYKH